MGLRSEFRNWLSIVLLVSVLLVSSLPAEELEVHLKDPVFQNGVMTTDQGGVITAKGLRIQAQKIELVHRTENGQPVHKITAEGDILLEYEGRPFVGKKLEYDFIQRRGKLWEGRTQTEVWFIGGEEIELLPDGSFWIAGAFLTTVEGQNPWWEIGSSKVKLAENDVITAKNIKFRFFKTPLFFLPSFKFNLKWLKDSPIRYQFLWEQILKQKVSMRYELYSNETFGLYGRLDYRFRKGPGAAIETDYQSLDGKSLFQTKSYGAYDKLIPDERGNRRFRFQGIWKTHSEDDRTHVHMTYDRMSDDKMPSDFKNDNFELNTQKRTIFWTSHHGDDFFGKVTVQPRINRFQSINQEVPLMTLGLRPVTLGNSGIITENRVSAGYLSYVFAKPLSHTLPSTTAARVEAKTSFYRPLPLGPSVITPEAGGVGIIYSNAPDHMAKGQAIGTYGLEWSTPLIRRSARGVHLVDPYAKLQGFTSPTIPDHNHFIFDLNDAYARLLLLRGGLRQSWRGSEGTRIGCDLYSYGFFTETAFHRMFPKVYGDLEISRASLYGRATVTYNIQELLLDTVNLRADWTASENCALRAEYRHRSRYDWRKADRESFILEAERPISDLVHSPISDGRNTFLAKVFFRFAPLWTCSFETHNGWGRRNEPRYNEFTLKLTTVVTGQWMLEFGLSYNPGNRWQAVIPSFRLVK